MSGGDGTPPGKAPKQLSSRLMTMKFMQRAALTPTGAAASASSPASGPNPKRLKNNSSQPSTPPSGPSTGTRTPAYPAAATSPSSKSGKRGDIDWQRAAREAARAEEDRRQAALDRAGTQGEETRWVLRTEDENNSSKPQKHTGLHILRYGEVDVSEDQEADGAEEDQPWRAEGVATGRMRFGGFKRKGEAKLPAKDASDDDGIGDESDSDASRSSKSSSKKSSLKDGTPRQSKAQQSPLQTPMRGRGGGISSGGGSSGRPSDGNAKCFRCGQPGHIKSNCPMNQGGMKGGTKRGWS